MLKKVFLLQFKVYKMLYFLLYCSLSGGGKGKHITHTNLNLLRRGKATMSFCCFSEIVCCVHTIHFELTSLMVEGLVTIRKAVSSIKLMSPIKLQNGQGCSLGENWIWGIRVMAVGEQISPRYEGTKYLLWQKWVFQGWYCYFDGGINQCIKQYINRNRAMYE